MPRHDLSKWIIHFVHKRNPANDPLEFSYDPEDFEYIDFPDGFKYDGTPIFLTEKYQEDDYGLTPDDYAFCVLKKILYDGFIRAGWSYRKGNPTIYGPKAAVCFTEMPLYGLIEYAKTRNNKNFAEEYGIAFIKTELFSAGARPVIYGLSTKHIEAKEGQQNYGIGLRTLSKETGIGIKEQYRYVYTNMDKDIDWTHEREWRWADINEEFDFPGLPVFAKNDRIRLSKIIVIVKTLEESEMIIDQLQNLFHSKSTNYDREYELEVIENTHVLALDELAKMSIDPNTARLDDLPMSRIPKIKKITVRAEILEKVKIAWEKASEICLKAGANYVATYGEGIGLCGYAHIITMEANSEITQAFIDLDIASSRSDGSYHLYGLDHYPSQLIDVSEAGARAAADFLTQELGQFFSEYSYLD